MAAVGSLNGKCRFYSAEGLRFVTQLDVRSTRGQNAKGKKITGLHALQDDMLLITSNDSRVRIYNTENYSLVCKFSGLVNKCSQIRASISDDGVYIVSGSEDSKIFLWSTAEMHTSASLPIRVDANESFSAHSTVTTTALFAPSSMKAFLGITAPTGRILVTADYAGLINVFAT
eukprot:gnl/Hemi2/19033_TR6300_c0_g1_i1.p1 gnl/Hemi2/19033_TR6300_c0_g1~~gnl/Hemi2/19033_TR6300_c0_g1_i1.p1  ORF type:complete len:174 (+),score=46.83 gnl/Hemi2/19033_TR6300_c0_g1_i1:71-592(+)